MVETARRKQEGHRRDQGIGVEPQRNADLNAWKQFIDHLEELDYFVVVIPDTETLLDGTSESDNWIQSFAPAEH